MILTSSQTLGSLTVRQLSNPLYNSIRMASSQSLPTVRLVSVNTAPDRAKVVIGQVIENVKDRYNIIHAGNTESESDGTNVPPWAGHLSAKRAKH
jgi:hypothetical protein